MQPGSPGRLGGLILAILSGVLLVAAFPPFDVGWLAWVALALMAPRAAAQTSEADKSAARELAKDAAQAFQNGQYQVAVDKFNKADQLFHAPTLVLGLARAYASLGKYVEAKEAYNRVIIEKLPPNASDQFIQAVTDAKTEIAGVEAKIGWGTINVASPEHELPAGLQATLDDLELKPATFGVKRPMNPGQHQLVITAPGYKDVDRRFDSKPHGEVKIDVTLERVGGGAVVGNGTSTGTGTGTGTGTVTGTGAGTGNPPAGDTGSKGNVQRILGFTGIGVGGGLLVMGAVTGGLALSKHGQLKELCPTGDCAGVDGAQAKIDSYELMGTLSTVGFIAGGVLAVAGVVVLVTAPKAGAGDKASLPLELAVGPAGARATWRF